MATVLDLPTKVQSHQTTLPNICVSGLKCNQDFCICDLINIKIKNDDYSLILCDECFKDLKARYKLFASRIRSLKQDFFKEYIAVKVSAELHTLRSIIDITGCGCGRKDCRLKDLTASERDYINAKFNTLYAVFSFSTRHTDTRSDEYRWLGFR